MVRSDVPAALQRLSPAVFAIARARLRAEHDAQDAVQETSMRALRGTPTDAPLDRWILAIAANVVRDMLRRGRTRRELAPPPPEPVELDPAGAIERAEDLDRVFACLRSLDPAESAPLLLHLVHGLPQAEVAGLLDLPLEHLRVRLFRTIRKIRQKLGIQT